MCVRACLQLWLWLVLRHIARALGKQSEAEKLAAEKVLAAQAKARLKANEKQRAAQPPAPRGPCTFFVRTGECARGAACRYAHHPNQVGLCPAFLRGVRAQAGKSAAGVGTSADAASGNGSAFAESMAIGCSRGDACPMSHDVSDADRMPPCPAFLRGNCVDLHCPLRHVKVRANTILHRRRLPLCQVISAICLSKLSAPAIRL